MGENESKICPTCQKAWAISFRFCPEDGSPLLMATAVPPVDPPVRSRGRKSSGRIMDLPPVSDADLLADLAGPAPIPMPTTRDKARPEAALPRSAAPVPTIKKELVAPRVDPTRRHGRPTIDQPVVPPVEQRPQRLVKGGAAAGRPYRTRGSDPGQTLAETPSAASLRELRNAPTLLQAPAVSAELIAEHARAAERSNQTVVNAKASAQAAKPARAPAEQPAPMQPPLDAPSTAPAARPVSPPTAPATPRAGKRKTTGGFSETDWFLAPIDPSLVDETTGKVVVDPERYKRNPAIPDEKRRRFSLGGDDEE